MVQDEGTVVLVRPGGRERPPLHNSLGDLPLTEHGEELPYQVLVPEAGLRFRKHRVGSLFVRERGLFMKPENKGRFYHDGRFQTLLDVVNSYNTRFTLGLTDQEKLDLVEYLKSL